MFFAHLPEIITIINTLLGVLNLPEPVHNSSNTYIFNNQIIKTRIKYIHHFCIVNIQNLLGVKQISYDLWLFHSESIDLNSPLLMYISCQFILKCFLLSLALRLWRCNKWNREILVWKSHEAMVPTNPCHLYLDHCHIQCHECL